MANLVKSCDVYCGLMKLGLHSGCIVDLNPLQLGVVAPPPPSGAEACVKSRLLGTRWDCAAQEGWATVYLGSCTVL
jgi:hypothetical protein